MVQEEIQDQLLLIDPPPDVVTRFKVEGNVAVLYTGPPPETQLSLPLLQKMTGGVAHIRIGEHFLDIYSQQHGTVVHIPALGIICGGLFGSDLFVPSLGSGSDGGSELDTLRLLASLIKKHPLQLYIPQIGHTESDPIKVIGRLASDVAYLHSIRRLIPSLVQRGDTVEEMLQMADAMLPSDKQHEEGGELSRLSHKNNLRTLYEFYA